jgi:hypothetical protein
VEEVSVLLRLRLTLLDPEKVASLDVVVAFVSLKTRKVYLQRSYRWMALVPFAVVLFLGLRFFPNSKAAVPFVFAVLLWAGFVIAYSFFLLIRCWRYPCPRCGWRFGAGETCGSCSLPRHSPPTSEVITAPLD